LKIKFSYLNRYFSLFNKRDKLRILFVIVLQASLGFLDLIGVVLIGIIGSLTVSGIQSGTPGTRVSNTLKFIGISEYKFQNQVAILGVMACILLISRTIFSVIITRKTLRFLSRKGAEISSDLTRKLLSLPLLDIQTSSRQESLYAVTHGAQVITLNVIANWVIVASDLSLLIIMGFGLIYINALSAIATIVFFGFLSFAIYKLSNSRAHKLGIKTSSIAIEINNSILESLNSYREIFVGNRRDFYVQRVKNKNQDLSKYLSQEQFLPNISKYIIESGVILGAVLISAVQFILQDANHAAATLAIFLAAGTRIAPAVMRIQQSLIIARTGAGATEITFNFLEKIKKDQILEASIPNPEFEHEGFLGEILISNVTHSYTGNLKPSLEGINLKIAPGHSVALVGPSGAGKTTLADVLLGVIKPDIGSIKISGLNPEECFTRWPGAVAYVPQEVAISNTTIKENIALGFSSEFIDDVKCWEALDTAQLKRFVENLPNGLDTLVGENGAKLSGGQKQRLGIARAMFTCPKVLILDEATSSLDGETESEFASSILKLKNTVTVVTIAHRLSTVKEADSVIYLEHGKVIYQGTFTEVRNSVPNFEKQAKLMGL
jgi:ABC-type multidrug transport system fused ATPase/permease subunit